MVATSLIAIAAAIAMMTIAHGTGSFTLLAAAGFGMGALPLYALSVAHTNDHADPNDYVAVSSTLLLVFGVGAVAGPFLTGVLRQNVTGPALFYFTAFIHALLVCQIIWRMRTSERPADEDRVEFADASIAAQTHMPIDPQAGTAEAASQ